MPGYSVKDVNQHEFVKALANHLKKSGKLKVPVGVGALCKMYGGSMRRGTAPSHFVTASPSVSRKVLQSLESMKMVEKDPTGGRRLSSNGRRDLERIASQMATGSKSKA